ncbi:type II secretion system protein M [Yersinia nurmii]|uniref:Type II secretion system protein M n=1 Tax=Yersinia nurmii TaxID=685706 RepID=A0AAW7K6A2_9GAMM|nr:type II secretion system protein M [Yersinia nurmii]MDN0086070.1 type II secretion system protein M [Yersinia nurmii]
MRLNLRPLYQRVVSNGMSIGGDILTHHWQPRSTREKWLIGVALCSLILAGYYWGVWQPLTRQIAQQEGVLQQQRALIAKMRAAAPEISAWRQQTQSMAENASVTSLSQRISTSAAEHKITLKRIQEREGFVQIWLEPLSFNSLLDWLNGLRQKSGVRAVQLDIVAADQPGIVNVQRLELAEI